MRLFVALALPAEVRRAIHGAAAPLRDALGRAVAWTPADTLHLTLRFLGDVPRAGLDDLLASLGEAAAASEPATLAIGGIGAFPSMGRPRVLWLGVAPDAALAALQARVERACAALGHAAEPRPFHPHVTLGRLRHGARIGDPAALARAAAAADVDPGAHHRLVIPTLDLMASDLTPAGARHTRLATLSLAPSSAGTPAPEAR